MELMASIGQAVDALEGMKKKVVTFQVLSGTDGALSNMWTITHNFIVAQNGLGYDPSQLPAYQEAKFLWLKMLLLGMPVKPAQSPFCSYFSERCDQCGFVKNHGFCYDFGSDYYKLITSLANMVNLCNYEPQPWTEFVKLSPVTAQAYDIYTVNMMEAAQTIESHITSWKNIFKVTKSFEEIMQNRVMFMNLILNDLPLEIWDTYAGTWRIAAFQEMPISYQFPLEGVKFTDKEINTTLGLRKFRDETLIALKNYWKPGETFNG